MNKTEAKELNRGARKTAKKYFATVPKNRNGKLVELLPNGKEYIVFFDLPFPLLQYHLSLLKKNILNTGKKYEIKYL